MHSGSNDVSFYSFRVPCPSRSFHFSFRLFCFRRRSRLLFAIRNFVGWPPLETIAPSGSCPLKSKIEIIRTVLGLHPARRPLLDIKKLNLQPSDPENSYACFRAQFVLPWKFAGESAVCANSGLSFRGNLPSLTQEFADESWRGQNFAGKSWWR